MRKLRRLLFRVFLFTFAIILGIVVVNTLSFSSKQLEFESVSPIKVSEEVSERLSEAIRIPTNSWTAERIDTQSFVQFLEFVENTFPLVDSLLERTLVNDFSMVYEWKGKDTRLDPILLLGHYDVVPVEEVSYEKWTELPYSGRIENGIIWGRGAMDDKMSVIGLLETAELMLQNGYEPNRSIYFAFGHDEEVSGQNGAKAIAKLFKSQGLRFEYVLDEGGMSLNGIIPGKELPVSLIGIAEKGYVTLTLKAQLEKGGHSSMPPKETAIGVLSAAIINLTKNPIPARMEEELTSLFFDYIGPEMNPLLKAVVANRWLFGGIMEWGMSKDPKTNASIRTTIAPTIIQGGVKENVLPTEAMAQVNFRIMPGDNVESVIAHVKKSITKEKVLVFESENSIAANPSPISPTDVFGFHIIQKTIQQILPKSIVTPNLVVGATDARFYTIVSDNIYRYSPMLLESNDLKRLHGIDERLSVENYQRMIAFYYQLIKNSCD